MNTVKGHVLVFQRNDCDNRTPIECGTDKEAKQRDSFVDMLPPLPTHTNRSSFFTPPAAASTTPISSSSSPTAAATATATAAADIFIVSDADEILREETIQLLKHSPYLLTSSLFDATASDTDIDIDINDNNGEIGQGSKDSKQHQQQQQQKAPQQRDTLVLFNLHHHVMKWNWRLPHQFGTRGLELAYAAPASLIYSLTSCPVPTNRSRSFVSSDYRNSERVNVSKIRQLSAHGTSDWLGITPTSIRRLFRGLYTDTFIKVAQQYDIVIWNSAGWHLSSFRNSTAESQMRRQFANFFKTINNVSFWTPERYQELQDIGVPYYLVSFTSGYKDAIKQLPHFVPSAELLGQSGSDTAFDSDSDRTTNRENCCKLPKLACRTDTSVSFSTTTSADSTSSSSNSSSSSGEGDPDEKKGKGDGNDANDNENININGSSSSSSGRSALFLRHEANFEPSAEERERRLRKPKEDHGPVSGGRVYFASADAGNWYTFSCNVRSVQSSSSSSTLNTVNGIVEKESIIEPSEHEIMALLFCDACSFTLTEENYLNVYAFVLNSCQQEKTPTVKLRIMSDQ